LLRFFNAVKELEQTIRNTEHPSIILEYMFLKLSYFSALVSIEDYLKRIRDVRPAAAVAAPASAPPASAPSAPAAAAPRPAEPAAAKGGEADWLPELKARVDREKPRMASVLTSSHLELRGSTLFIEVAAHLENAWKMMKENRSYLNQLARELAGRELGLEIVLKEGPAKDEGERVVQELKNDKKIKSLKDKIKGSVIAVESVKGGKDA